MLRLETFHSLLFRGIGRLTNAHEWLQKQCKVEKQTFTTSKRWALTTHCINPNPGFLPRKMRINIYLLGRYWRAETSTTVLVYCKGCWIDLCQLKPVEAARENRGAGGRPIQVNFHRPTRCFSQTAPGPTPELQGQATSGLPGGQDPAGREGLVMPTRFRGDPASRPAKPGPQGRDQVSRMSRREAAGGEQSTQVPSPSPQPSPGCPAAHCLLRLRACLQLGQPSWQGPRHSSSRAFNWEEGLGDLPRSLRAGRRHACAVQAGRSSASSGLFSSVSHRPVRPARERLVFFTKVSANNGEKKED